MCILALLASVLLAGCTLPASERAGAGEPATGELAINEMLVYRSPTCGCCTDWVDYVEAHGYTVTVEDVPDLAAVKAEHNVPLTMQSCHTAVIDGYVIEGHVPAEDIDRLLTERPDVAGIAVPGMPIGSPGMEIAGAEPQPFTVMTFDAAGNTDVYSAHKQ